jgi:membrane-bound serine protease (ClpP class)
MLIWGLALLAMALLLVAIEMFVPSMGIIAIVATLVGIAGIVCLFKVSAAWGITGIGVAIVLVPTIVAFGFKLLPSTPMGRKMLFGEDGEHRPVLGDEPRDEYANLVGMEGDALTDLRPVGVARFGAERVDVLSEVAYIRAGERVRVTAVEGLTIKVRPVTAA